MNWDDRIQCVWCGEEFFPLHVNSKKFQIIGEARKAGWRCDDDGDDCYCPDHLDCDGPQQCGDCGAPIIGAHGFCLGVPGGFEEDEDA